MTNTILNPSPQLLESLKKITSGQKRLGVMARFPDEAAELIRLTSFLPDEVPFSRRIWHVTNKQATIPLCNHCGKKETKWNGGIGYSKYCSVPCSNVASKSYRKFTI